MIFLVLLLAFVVIYFSLIFNYREFGKLAIATGILLLSIGIIANLFLQEYQSFFTGGIIEIAVGFTILIAFINKKFKQIEKQLGIDEKIASEEE